MSDPLVYTVEEAAQVLMISRGSAYAGVRDGSIPAIRINRTWRVPRARLMEMLGESDEPQAVTRGSSEPEIPIGEKGLGSAPD